MQNLTLPDSKFFEAESTLESPVDDWSDTTQEMLDTLPQTWSRSILCCIVAFGAIALPWAMLAKVDEVGVARGRLEPRGKTLRLDAVTSGTVAAVKVKTGQQVKKGDRIIELNADLIKSELQQTQAKLDGLVNRYAQLTGLRSHLEVAIRTQQQQRQSQELEQVAQISQTRQRIGFYRNSATLSQAVLTKDQGKAARYRTFREQGIVAGVQVEDAERAEIESQQRVEQARSEIAQTLAELQKQQSTYQKILRQSDLAILDSAKQIKELETQMSDLKSEIKQTQNQLRSLQFQWKQRVISVPVEGTIFQLPIQNAGAVVQTGQNVAQIAPIIPIC
jgi:hemolysin D